MTTFMRRLAHSTYVESKFGLIVLSQSTPGIGCRAEVELTPEMWKALKNYIEEHGGDYV